MNDAEREKALKKLVHDHQVCWEVHTVESKPLEGERITVGYELTLVGIAGESVDPAAHIDERVAVVLKALHELADDLKRLASKDATLKATPYDEGLQASPVRHHRPETALKLALTHRDAFQTPVDAAQEATVQAWKERLKALGSTERHWKEA